MSEEGDGGSTADSDAGAESENLEDRVDSGNTPENTSSNEQYDTNEGAEYSDVSDEYSQTAYRDSGSKKEGNKAAQKRAEKAGNERKDSDNTEETLEEKVNEQIEEMVDELVKMGVTEKEARKLAEEIKTKRDETKHNWVSLPEWYERIAAIERQNFFRGVKGLWYLAFALADCTPAENPYEKIRAGANVIYVPGYLAIPRDLRDFEKVLGRKVARVETTDIGELHKIIQYAADMWGKVELVGFSDGGPLVCKYIEKYGDELIDTAYNIASIPSKTKSKRVVDIVGSYDWLAPLEVEYGNHPKNVLTYNGGHTFAFMDRKAMGEIAGMINSTMPRRTYYPVTVDDGSMRIMRRLT
jgi:hypothetical protein